MPQPESSAMTEPRLFCFGLGYTGLRLARAARARGWRVAGTCRDASKAAALRREGIATFLFDGTHPLAEPAAVLRDTTHLLCSVPPDAESDPVLRLHIGDIAQLREPPAWLGLLSSTGVYGDCGGAWIDESQPEQPATDDNRRRLAAERAWHALGVQLARPVALFRLPGIYGPQGRNPIDALWTGRARRIVKPGQVFNRIHVDDLVAALLASMDRDARRADSGPHLYNVCDDEPAPADAVLVHAAELLGLTPPPAIPFATAQLSAFARHFYLENRRIRNERIKRELGIQLRYPTYREGLAAIVAASADARAAGPDGGAAGADSAGERM
jgi:nucleoside-diphosphate-sugar epimerase